MPIDSIAAILVFIFGAIVGSFLNVCIYRIPRERSIVRPGSSCPECGASIRFYDNIPVIGYLLLKGRCRQCKAPISARYPLVEILTAVLFLVAYSMSGVSFELVVILVFICLLIVISFIDLDFMIIPDSLSLGGIILGFALSFFRRDISFIDSLLGILVGGGVLFAIAKIYELVRKREGMGGGDIKLLGMIGAFSGMKGVIFSLIAGSFAGTLVGIPLMLIKGQGAKYALPFGPFLSLGALLYVIAGNRIIYAFFNLL